MNQNIQNRKKLLESQIVERQDISDLMIKLWVTKPTDYSFKPGQYCTLGVEGVERAYSIASSPDEEYMELFIELVEEEGILTPLIWKMNKGDIFTLRPRAKGIFQIKDQTLKNYLLISTVTGVVPYVSFVRSFMNENQTNMKFHILQGSSYVDEFGYLEELQEISKTNQEHINYIPTISRPKDKRNENWKGMIGRVNLIVDQYIKDNDLNPENSIVFACGNPDMIIDIQNNLAQNKGFNVIEERFWK